MGMGPDVVCLTWLYLKGFEMTKVIRNGLVAAGVLVATVNSALAGVDVTPVVTEISGASVPIGLIGSAVLVVMVGIKVYKWVRRAM